MIGYLILAAIYTGAFMLTGKFDFFLAIVSGLLVAAVSIGVTKLFGMDKGKGGS